MWSRDQFKSENGPKERCIGTQIVGPDCKLVSNRTSKFGTHQFLIRQLKGPNFFPNIHQIYGYKVGTHSAYLEASKPSIFGLKVGTHISNLYRLWYVFQALIHHISTFPSTFNGKVANHSSLGNLLYLENEYVYI